MKNRKRKQEQEIVDKFVNAAADDDIDAVKRYIDAGGDVNVKSCGVTALYMAALYGSEDIVWLLLRAGADPNLANDTSEESIRFMDDSGLSQEEMRSKGHVTPLFIAAEHGRLDVVKLLLSLRADPNQVIHTCTYNLANKFNFFDTSPIQHAREKGFTEIVQLMKKPRKQIVNNMLRDLRHDLRDEIRRESIDQNQFFSKKSSSELVERGDVSQCKRNRRRMP